MRATRKLALKINTAKFRTQGGFLFGIVWAMTLVAVLERSVSAKQDSRKEDLVHE
jgi:hypothetical protein